MGYYTSASTSAWSGNTIAGILLAIIIIICLFLLFREVMTWYWKINKIVSLLEKIDNNTKPEVSLKAPSAVDPNAAKPVAK
jgi:hypothetical protein